MAIDNGCHTFTINQIPNGHQKRDPLRDMTFYNIMS